MSTLSSIPEQESVALQSGASSSSQPLDITRKVANFEFFINNVLKEKLKLFEISLDRVSSELAEYIQLKNIIETFQEGELDGLSTQVDVGCNYYLQAKSNDSHIDKILVNVGLNTYVELSLKQALAFTTNKIEVYNLQTKEIRKNIAVTKAHIKLTLIGIQELLNVK
uniref:Protein UXT homolog n=1 Tax=Cacopsylla melanoneura TaxID=428564 RepID=A0A8D8UAX8_9HEMI